LRERGGLQNLRWSAGITFSPLPGEKEYVLGGSGDAGQGKVQEGGGTIVLGRAGGPQVSGKKLGGGRGRRRANCGHG